MSTGLAAKTGADVFGTISVAMVTPFTTTNNVDLDKATQLARHLVDHGVDSLVLAGTTGESPTTTLSEKLDLLTAVGATCELPPQPPVIRSHRYGTAHV